MIYLQQIASRGLIPMVYRADELPDPVIEGAVVCINTRISSVFPEDGELKRVGKTVIRSNLDDIPIVDNPRINDVVLYVGPASHNYELTDNPEVVSGLIGARIYQIDFTATPDPETGDYPLAWLKCDAYYGTSTGWEKLVYSGGPTIPDFSYTGEYLLIDDGEGNWRAKFLSSGTFTPNVDMLLDVFCVGGGGAGGYRQTSSTYSAGSGGGGGYTNTGKNLVAVKNQPYTIVVGAGGSQNSGSTPKAGSNTSAFGVVGEGGKGGTYQSGAVVTAGGNGGSAGGNGITAANISPAHGNSDGVTTSGTGVSQGFTTREFGELTGELYSGGGGGGNNNQTYNGGNGGAGGYTDATLGGGIGGNYSKGIIPTAGHNGGQPGRSDNVSYPQCSAGGGGGGYGGGGGGAGPNATPCFGGAGAPGIVVIRNARGAGQ